MRDASVDYRTVEAFAKTRPNVTLSLLEDDHQLIASLPRIWNDVAAIPRARIDARSPPHRRCRGRARGSTFGLRVQRSVGSSQNAEPGTSNPDPGTLRVGFLRPGGGYTVTTLPMEPYVARVLAGEAVRESRPAALEALAITIRTFALANRGRHRADGFDMCDQTHCQVVRTAVAATERAAQATAGRVLLHDGVAGLGVLHRVLRRPHREAVERLARRGGSIVPAVARRRRLRGRAGVDRGDRTSAISLRALRASGFRGDRLRDVRIASRNGSGRVARLTLEGLRPDQISGQDLRVVVGRTLGWQHIKSTAFDLRRQGDAYVFSGHGSGHGVGMCVIGAARLAERGSTADAILARYFPGLPISDGGQTGVRTGVRPPSDPVARSAEKRPPAAAGGAGVRPPSDPSLSPGANSVTGVSLSLAGRGRGAARRHRAPDAPRAGRAGAHARRRRAGRA